jgi:beta-lactamase regulating signal transducer with metallopeptidase domain
MTGLMNWLSPSAMQSLGWALLHFLWQGTALAALAAGAMALCRRTSARYIVGVVGLAVMLLAPLATFFFYLQPQAVVVDTATSSIISMTALQTTPKSKVSVNVTIVPSLVSRSLNALPWLVELWLLGVAFFSLRSAGGFVLLERERRRQSTVVSPSVLVICRRLQQQLGLSRAIQYCECKWLQAPAVIGWFRPIVFLPINALTGLSEDQLQSVIAHELAHIQRFDPFVNVFQVCVETLLFYHPAVWWLNKRIRAEREHCCDDTAVALCGNAVEYARALTLMEEWRSAPTFAMAANRGPLTERIIRVLGLKTLGAGMRSVGFTGSVLCLTAALVAGNALLGIAHPSPVQASPTSQGATNPAAHSAQSSAAKSTPVAKPSASHPHIGDEATATEDGSSYIDAMKSAGVADLSADTLIALKIQDVTPDYVRGLHEQGLQPDANALIAMRAQGITPDYVRELRAAGLNPDQSQLIALKVQGADGEYYRGLKEAGIQSVTAEYVRGLRAAGLTPTADEVIAMKVQDVTPAYLKGMHDLGLQPTGSDTIAMRVQDVTPEYVRDIQALGFKPSVNELIAMRVQDVTPEYIKALQAAGFKVGINEIIGAKVQDVTPEFIGRARAHGFKDLTLQKLIQLRQLGILDSKADI